jgi:tripartite-type tricarboxylate transporter receptor subunit TctC
MRFALSLLAFGALLPAAALAQAWPVKPIRMIVTVATGSAADTTARLSAAKLGETLGQPVVVENVAAMGGSIGAERVSRLAPDGYNLMFTTPSPIISAFFQRKNVPYKISDFTPVTAAVEPVTVFATGTSLPVNSLKEFIDYAKRNPGKASYGTPGIGSVFHMMGEAFSSNAGIQMLHVPYKSGVTQITDLTGGQIDIVLTAYSNVQSQISAGKVKALAVLEGSRYAALPNAPAVNEVLPRFEKPASWFALFGPAPLPRPITQRLHADMVKALNSPDVRTRLEGAGMTIIGNTLEEFAALIKRGFEVYGAVFKAAGLQPED